MSLGDEICTYLQAQITDLNFNGTGRINLFSSLLPDQPDLGVAVIERGGLPTVMWLTGTGPRVNESLLDRPSFMVKVRSGMKGYLVGNELVQDIFGALQGITEETINLGGALFHLIESMQSPAYIGRDEKERHQWTQNYRVMWENTQRAA